jgi:hypothetical protein
VKHPYDASSPASDNAALELFAELRDWFVHRDLEQKLILNMILYTAAGATRHIYTNTMNGKQMTILDPATKLWKKKGDVKHYKDESIVNILVEL